MPDRTSLLRKAVESLDSTVFSPHSTPLLLYCLQYHQHYLSVSHHFITLKQCHTPILFSRFQVSSCFSFLRRNIYYVKVLLLTRRFAHSNLALALHQWVERCLAHRRHRGSFGGEAGELGSGWGWRRWRGCRRCRTTTLCLIAELCERGGHALVVACGAQEVIQDLQNGADVTPRPSAAVLTVWMQSAYRGRRKVDG